MLSGDKPLIIKGLYLYNAKYCYAIFLVGGIFPNIEIAGIGLKNLLLCNKIV